MGTDQQVRVKDYFDSSGNGHGRLNVVLRDNHIRDNFRELSGTRLIETIARHENWSEIRDIPEIARHVGHVLAHNHPWLWTEHTNTSNAPAPRV
ncbi:MAG: hypothetical protein ACR2RF_28270 [Geminicoccaceae bacterium]